MLNRENITQELVSSFQAIQNLDDFKSREDEIIDLMDKYIKSAIDLVKDFQENMLSMTPQEREEKVKEFQNDSFPFEPLVEKELQRLDTLPGFIDYAEEFGPRMDKMMEPHMKQYGEHMEKIMGNVMGAVDQVMGGMMDGMSQAFGNVEEEVEEAKVEEEEKPFEFNYDDPDTLEMLYELYSSRTLEDLKEYKEGLIESMEEELQSDIWDLEIFRDMPAEELFESDKEKIARIRKQMERLEPEMEKEFARLESLPEAAEEANAIRMEISGRLNRKIKTVRGILRNLN